MGFLPNARVPHRDQSLHVTGHWYSPYQNILRSIYICVCGVAALDTGKLTLRFSVFLSYMAAGITPTTSILFYFCTSLS